MDVYTCACMSMLQREHIIIPAESQTQLASALTIANPSINRLYVQKRTVKQTL